MSVATRRRKHTATPHLRPLTHMPHRHASLTAITMTIAFGTSVVGGSRTTIGGWRIITQTGYSISVTNAA